MLYSFFMIITICWTLEFTMFYCSIEFDRDDELFATAGVSRCIKVFDFSKVRFWFKVLFYFLFLVLPIVAEHKWDRKLA